ncbi:MAG: FAD:protein FMN transferase, partial [Gammaproteobacteria bacterium]
MSAHRNLARGFCVTAWLTCFVFLDGCGAGDYLRFEGGTMGTYSRVTTRCPGAREQEIADAVAAELEAVNHEMSTFLPDSTLSRFNAAPPDGWVPVSHALAEVVEVARQLSVLSGGAFDVTVGPLVDLWGFGP